MQEATNLRAMFQANLDVEAWRNAWGSKERVLWILDHLDEYLERWIGFAALPISPQALIQSDLFTVVEVAVEALEHEFSHSVTLVAPRYLKEIKEEVKALREHGHRERAIAIKQLVVELRSNFPT